MEKPVAGWAERNQVFKARDPFTVVERIYVVHLDDNRSERNGPLPAKHRSRRREAAVAALAGVKLKAALRNSVVTGTASRLLHVLPAFRGCNVESGGCIECPLRADR
jgi:hypothetical protein